MFLPPGRFLWRPTLGLARFPHQVFLNTFYFPVTFSVLDYFWPVLWASWRLSVYLSRPSLYPQDLAYGGYTINRAEQINTTNCGKNRDCIKSFSPLLPFIPRRPHPPEFREESWTLLTLSLSQKLLLETPEHTHTPLYVISGWCNNKTVNPMNKNCFFTWILAHVRVYLCITRKAAFLRFLRLFW